MVSVVATSCIAPVITILLELLLSGDLRLLLLDLWKLLHMALLILDLVIILKGITSSEAKLQWSSIVSASVVTEIPAVSIVRSASSVLLKFLL